MDIYRREARQHQLLEQIGQPGQSRRHDAPMSVSPHHEQCLVETGYLVSRRRGVGLGGRRGSMKKDGDWLPLHVQGTTV